MVIQYAGAPFIFQHWINSTNLSTFRMSFNDLDIDGPTSTSHAGETGPDFQSLDQGRSVDGAREIRPVFS